MNEDFTPIAFLMRVQKTKLRATAIPILVVIIGLFLSSYASFSNAKYLSLAGLILYFVIILQFRIGKKISPEIDSRSIYSPINGMITGISEENNMIVVFIKKGFFQPAEIRCPSADEKVNFIFEKGKTIWFENFVSQPKRMMGIVPGSAFCRCSFPKEYKLRLQKKDKVIAGETTVGTKV